MTTPKETARERRKRELGASLAAAMLTIRVRFDQFVEAAQSDAVIASVEASLEAGNPAQAITTIANQLAPMRTAVAETFIQAGNASMAEIAADPAGVLEAATIAPPAGATVIAEGAVTGGGGGGGVAAGGGGSGAGGGPIARIGIAFDPLNQRASDLMRREADLLVRQISQDQVEVIRQVIAESFQIGRGPRATAQIIKESIGLTPYQEGIVRNYREALESRSTRALNYQLRNRARDEAVNSAAQPGARQLSPAQIDRMVSQYRKNFVRHRADTIARTESTRVTSMARDESYRQIADKLGIGHNRIIRVWTPTEDDRTREWHADMDGQEAAVGQPFIDGLGNKLMYPGDPSAPAETVINCRCALTMRIAGD